MAKYEILNAYFGYGDHQILSNLNLSLNSGCITALLGRNAQGKSTLLKIIMGILKPNSAKIITNASFSYLPQNFYIAYDFKVLDIVLMGRAKKISLFSSPSKKDQKEALSLLENMKISDLKDRKFSTLSGGQKQLILCARAIYSNSDFILLDEPMSQLDIKNQNRVLNLLNSLKSENLGIIFSTHDPNHALSIAENTLILFDDLTYKFGKTKDVINDSSLQKLYDLSFLIPPDLNAVVPKFQLNS